MGETLENLKSRYRSSYMVKDVLRIELESFDAHIEGVEEEECQVFLISFYSTREERLSLPLDLEEFEVLTAYIKEIVAKDPLSTFTLNLGLSKGLKEAKSLLKEYLDRVKLSIRSMGIMRGCLLVTLGDQMSKPLAWNFVLIPFDYELEEASQVVRKFCGAEIISIVRWQADED